MERSSLAAERALTSRARSRRSSFFLIPTRVGLGRVNEREWEEKRGEKRSARKERDAKGTNGKGGKGRVRESSSCLDGRDHLELGEEGRSERTVE